MEKIKVAICDDEIILLPQLASVIRDLLRKQKFEAETSTFSSSAELLKALYLGNTYNIYFLDIDMPEQNGIVLAEKIRIQNNNALIVYISAREDLVYDTFPTQPVAFVRKSHFTEDIKHASEILSRFLQKPKDTIIPFTDELGHTLSLNLSRILYVEAQEKYQDIVSIDGSQMIRCSISHLDRVLSPFHFFRIHRSFLVNFRYIYRIDSTCVCLDDGQKLPLSRHRRKEVQQLFLTCAQVPPVQNNSMEV